MPLIKPRTRGKQFVRHIARLDRENLEALYAYARIPRRVAPDYVLNEIVDTVLAKDKDFATWRAEHPQSFRAAPRCFSLDEARRKNPRTTQPRQPRRRAATATGAARQLDAEGRGRCCAQSSTHGR